MAHMKERLFLLSIVMTIVLVAAELVVALWAGLSILETFAVAVLLVGCWLGAWVGARVILKEDTVR